MGTGVSTATSISTATFLSTIVLTGSSGVTTQTVTEYRTLTETYVTTIRSVDPGATATVTQGKSEHPLKAHCLMATLRESRAA